jgi:hypothetical protein
MSTLTPEMTKAAYEAVKQIASDKGYGWEFRMVSEADADALIEAVFAAALAAAPVGWTAYTAPEKTATSDAEAAIPATGESGDSAV